MKVAVLPFATRDGISPAVGRQLANFAMDTVSRAPGAEIGFLNMIAQLADQPGRVAYHPMGEHMMEREQLQGVFEQIQVDMIMDGLVSKTADGMQIDVRFTLREDLDNAKLDQRKFEMDGVFDALRWLVQRLADESGLMLPPDAVGEGLQFGTPNGASFVKFIEGYDALSYVRQANGMVSQEFNPKEATDALFEAVELDPDFEGAYTTLLELSRMCAQFRIGRFVDLEESLLKLSKLIPEDFRTWYILAEIHMTVGEVAEAAAFYEKAIELEPEDPALYTHLGIAQMAQNMPVNAERNFRKALEREGADKPSLGHLADVLLKTNRAHEVPPLWKELVEANPQNGSAYANYGYALLRAGKTEESEKVFEQALEVLEDSLPVKRFYAPILAEKGDLDQAMNFYEDCLDVNPTDVGLMMEYAQTLDKAGRDFEVPPVLRNILATSPDPNTKAQAMGWLIELEQPKRVEAVQAANAKAEAGDYEGAVRDLKPLRNWMGEYWKFWAILAQCFNRLEQYTEAEEAAGRLINLIPGYEPGYGELMQALTAQEKHEQAYNAMKWAAMNMPQSLPIHLNLGLAAHHAGRLDEAKALAKQIREAVGANEQIEPVLAEMES